MTAATIHTWLTDFLHATFARAADSIHGVHPGERIAVDVAERVAVAAVDELFARIGTQTQGDSMIWSMLLPIILQAIEWLWNRKHPSTATPAGTAAAGSDAQADTLAAQVKDAIARMPKEGDVGHDGGIVAHLEALYTALMAHDWAAVLKAVQDILTHL